MKKHFKPSTLNKLVAGDRFYFAWGGRKGMPATLVYKTKEMQCCYHIGHAYDETAKRFVAHRNSSVWVGVK